MESARPRAEERLCGPRAGQLHFAIWHMCHRSVTIRLCSLQRAPIRRRKILASSKCDKILREIWQRSADHDGWWVGNYILMPDHVHLFARPEIGAGRMAEWVQMWKSVSSRRIAAVLSIKPSIWQPEYFDRYLRSSENYSEKWHYVEQNAVRAGLVEIAEAWPYRGTINNLMF